MRKLYFNDKRGLSTVVTTLILVLLIIVAIALVWGIVQNLLTNNQGTIDVNSKCLGITVKATNVQCDATNKECSLTLERSGTDDSPIAGVKLVFEIEDKKKVVRYKDNINAYGSKSLDPVDTKPKMNSDAGQAFDGLTFTAGNSGSVEAVVYFKSESGQEIRCPKGLKSDFTITAP